MALTDNAIKIEFKPTLSKNSDMVTSIAVIAILVFMIIPLPSTLLDFLITFNISFALVILLVAMYTVTPLELSSFPSILLLITLFRLSLNVASTRIILIHGNEGTLAAGKIINAFGNFVVGGNYLVGIIVYLILVVINFMVITKGAGRIAEVAARFTLDAMPGKQMSIDAELNAGIINENEAKIRRTKIAFEAEYYGAMDGANKFVRGDAIASIIITLANIIGGLTIGVFQNKMSIENAAHTYTLLTIGDGLVAQIPALIISTSAGIIVSRAGAEKNLGSEITSQILFQPRALEITAIVLFGFGIIPGIPFLPFWTLAALVGSMAFWANRAVLGADKKRNDREKAEKTISKTEKPLSLPLIDIIALEIGYSLIPLVDTAQSGKLLDKIKSVRQQIAHEMGIIIPPVHIKDNMRFKPGEYAIFLKGIEIARAELLNSHWLAMKPGLSDEKLDGILTNEPIYGLPAYWIKENTKEIANEKGFTVVDLTTIVATHISEIIKSYSPEFIGRQEVQQLLDIVKETHPKVVEELIPNLLPLGTVVKVLQNLLREQIPIRDLLTILEILADWSINIKDPDILTKYVRHGMSRTITKINEGEDGILPVIDVSKNVEIAICSSIEDDDRENIFVIDPTKNRKILNNLKEVLEKTSSFKYQPVLVCSPQIRSHFKKLIDQYIPNISVLSYDEINQKTKIKSLGTLDFYDSD